MALPAEKLTRKPKADPTAKSQGRAGVLPQITDIEHAFAPLDEAMSQQMAHEYEHGREKGQTTNNTYLDPHFKWMPGYTNIITGWGGHGKSQFFFELLLLRAVYNGKKTVVWPSENLPARHFYNGLIHTLTGRPVERTFTNCLSWPEYKKAQDFIREHFLAIDPPIGMPYTPAHILAYFEAGMKQLGDSTAHCMYDPWNKGDHTAKNRMFGGSDEAYIGHVLGMCTKWSQDAKQCLVITAHPKRPSESMRHGETRPVPTGAHISGGQMWENMAHYVGAVHRPFHHVPGSTAAAFYCHKCKDERNVAKIGSVGAIGHDGFPPKVLINWSEISNRYLWGAEKSSPLDRPAFAKIWQTPEMPALPAALQSGGSLVSTPPLASLPSTLQSEFDQLPEDFHPNGRIIRLATND